VDLTTLVAFVVLAICLIALYATIRVTQMLVDGLQRGRSARRILERRLAKGQISPEEFFELESALRSSDAPRSARPRRLLRL